MPRRRSCGRVPALASVLFLAAAVAAALLAAGAAVLGLYQAGRRRRYEYAAMVVGRVPRRALRSSVLIEQAAVLGFGVVTGVAAGIGSAVLVLRNLPEFPAPPAAPPLLFARPATQVLVPLMVIVDCWWPRRTVAAVSAHPVGPARAAQGGPAMTTRATAGRPPRPARPTLARPPSAVRTSSTSMAPQAARLPRSGGWISP